MQFKIGDRVKWAINPNVYGTVVYLLYPDETMSGEGGCGVVWDDHVTPQGIELRNLLAANGIERARKVICDSK